MDWRNHLTAAHGYLELGMGQEAWDELDSMPAQDRARPEVVVMRLVILQSMARWDKAAEIARGAVRDGLPCTILLCGDFNCDPGQDGWAGDDTFRILGDAGFIWAGKGQPRDETVTWISDGRYPDAAFDHFLVRPAKGVTAGRASTEKTDRGISDHRPLTMRVGLP